VINPGYAWLIDVAVVVFFAFLVGMGFNMMVMRIAAILIIATAIALYQIRPGLNKSGHQSHSNSGLKNTCQALHPHYFKHINLNYSRQSGLKA
jgi:hypothetical protein